MTLIICIYRGEETYELEIDRPLDVSDINRLMDNFFQNIQIEESEDKK